MNNNIRIAQKLVRLAKEIISSNNNVADKSGKYKNFSGIINFENKEGKISGIVENATFELFEENNVLSSIICWEKGTWENGTWENGLWYDGTWKNGIWKDGFWNDGTWKNGTWKNGWWFCGVWKKGTWIIGFDKDGKNHTVNPNEW